MAIRYRIIGAQILLSLLTISSQASSQDEPGIITTRLRNDSAANDISMRTLSMNYQNNRRNIFWPYEGSRMAAFDFGVSILHNKGNTPLYDFEGQQIVGSISGMFSPNHYLTFSAGPHILKNSIDGKVAAEQTFITKGVNYGYIKGPFQLSFDFKNDFMYGNLFLPAGVEERLIENRFELSSKYKFLDSFTASASANQIFINDDNEFTTFQSGVAGEYVIHPVSLFGGLGASYGQSKYRTSRYPSPWYVVGGGPHAGANYSIRNGLAIAAGYAYTRFVDDLEIEGYETNRFIQIDFGDRNELEIQISYVWMDSISLGEVWYDKQLNFNLAYSM